MIRPYERNDNFVGRDREIADIAGHLDPKKEEAKELKKYALIGLGGVGKTQTALAYVFRSWDKFKAILWAQADTPSKLLQSFTDFACDMGLVNSRSDQQEAWLEAERWFATTGTPISLWLRNRSSLLT